MVENSGKIQRMTIRGFKSIREMYDLELKNINILIGANGAGKSNFISIFNLLLKISRGELQYYTQKKGGARRLMYMGGREFDHIWFEIYIENSYWLMKLLKSGDDNFVIFRESGLVSEKKSRTAFGVPADYMGQEVSVHFKEFYKKILKMKVYHFHDTTENSPIRSTSDTVEMDTLLSDGANLAAFLYYLQERYPNNLEYIEAAVRGIAPFFQSFLLKPDPLNERYIRLRWRHIGAEEAFDVSDLSDGTLRFIALAALLLQPNPPPTIIIDEPELGLHPAAIAQLAAMIHQVSPDVQIIAATQSPTFASYFGWQDFIVVERKDEASTFRRLTEEEVKPWLDDFSMGAIWEMNLIGGQPK